MVDCQRKCGVGRDERAIKALKAIDLVGLDGFESAYPKELSGGMKQRVGFARAFVLEPQILFMDEPFSALDVLTAENLRGEIDDLWNANTFPSKSILIVTHNIEEAVFLADRVIILGSNPGCIRGELAIDLPRPHDRTKMICSRSSMRLYYSDLPQFPQAIFIATAIGQDFATTTILRSKELFQQQALTQVPVLLSMIQTLQEKRSGSMRKDFFLDLWSEHVPTAEAERQFATAVDWGRYAELFEYDAREERLYLPELHSAVGSSETTN